MFQDQPEVATERPQNAVIGEITTRTLLQTTSVSPTPSSEGHILLDKIIFNHLIHEVIFFNLTPVEFFRLARTCRLAYEAVQSYIRRTFNINRSLSRFFSDPVEFRALQARTGTLISGSFALQFFDRSFYPESDLDLYSPKDADREVLSWLPSHGYKFVPSEKQPPTLEEAIVQSEEPHVDDDDWTDYGAIVIARTIRAVYTFTKAAPSGSDAELKVQCIVASRSPMEVILSFHSTCVMSVITHEQAYCLYPHATLHVRQTLSCGKYPSPSRAAALLKYASRGFEVVGDTRTKRYDLQYRHSFFEGMRYLGDPKCWTLPLNTAGVLPESIPGDPARSADPVIATSWDLVMRYFEIQMLFTVVHPSRSHGVCNFVVAKSILPHMRITVQFHGDEDAQINEEFIAYCVTYNPVYYKNSPRFCPEE